MANAQVARRLQSKAGNPEFNFTEHINNFSVGEIIAPFIALGDRDDVTVRRDFTVYVFGKLSWWNKTIELPLTFS